MKRRITVFGSTGSIGKSTLSLLTGELKDFFEVEALTCDANWQLALAQARASGAKRVVVGNYEAYLKAHESAGEIEVLYGQEGLFEVARSEASDVIVMAIIGMRALQVTLESIIAGKPRVIALANKECIIAGWHLIKRRLQGTQVRVIPVDSEHNSLFRLLENVSRETIESILITASGGPFLGKKFATLGDVCGAKATNHPVWSMGRKISVDSATMANKGLELIEACKLFGFREAQVEAYVHTSHVLHAAVNMTDKSTIALLSHPDMRVHIAHAIMDGDVKPLHLRPVNLAEVGRLEFGEILPDEFPIFFIAREVARADSTPLCVAFNLLNEIAVEKFLAGKIKYTEIYEVIRSNLEYNPDSLTFETLEEFDAYESCVRKLLQ